MKKGKILSLITIVLAGSLGIFAAGKHNEKTADNIQNANEETTTTQEEQTQRTSSVKKMVQIYVDPALYDVTVESESDYVTVYQSADYNTPIAKLHRGSWVTYKATENDMLEILMDDGTQGFIPAENGEVSEVTIYDPPTSLSEFKIVLDAGHGGDDSGAVSPDESILEKDLTLTTVKKVGDILTEAGVQVTYTRTEDVYLSLAKITEFSLAASPDLFLSIHYDDFEYANGNSGFTTYYYAESAKNIGQIVNDSLESTLPLRSNGLREGNYFVIREQYVPSLLLELGYMNSDYDLSVITEDEYPQQVATAILSAINEIIDQNQSSQ